MVIKNNRNMLMMQTTCFEEIIPKDERINITKAHMLCACFDNMLWLT